MSRLRFLAKELRKNLLHPCEQSAWSPRTSLQSTLGLPYQQAPQSSAQAYDAHGDTHPGDLCITDSEAVTVYCGDSQSHLVKLYRYTWDNGTNIAYLYSVVL